jgi:biopolymer transport protein ExbD
LRRRDALHVWELHYGPNMTPMVDVVMVILIFYMAAASFVGPEWFLNALVPQRHQPRADASGGLVLPPARFTVRLAMDGAGRTSASGLGLAGVGLDAMSNRIAALTGDVGADEIMIEIIPAPDVPYQDVIRVHDACERAGVDRVSLGK